MALNPLTLTVDYGIVGSRFLSALNGRTAGSVLSVVSGSPGFDVVNGYLRNIAVPYEADSVTVREYVPATGESRETTFTITAVTQGSLRQAARAASGVRFRVFYKRAPDRSIQWAYAYELADGTLVINLANGQIAPPGFSFLLGFDNDQLIGLDGEYLYGAG